MVPSNAESARFVLPRTQRLNGRSALDPLVERAKSGEKAAFRELFELHREMVARVVYRMLGPSPEVEDVVQDVFVNVFRSLHTFRGDSKFTTWLYRLATNVTKMHLRKKRSRPRFVDVPDDRPVERVESRTPRDEAEQRERITAIYRLLDQLSEKKREVIVLHDFEGISAKEISERVGAPVLTVRTRLFYARKELYAALENEPVLSNLVDHLKKKKKTRPKKSKARQSSSSEFPIAGAVT